MDKLLSNGDGVQGFGFMDLLKQEEPQQPAQQQTVQPRLGSLAQPGPGERGSGGAASAAAAAALSGSLTPAQVQQQQAALYAFPGGFAAPTGGIPQQPMAGLTGAQGQQQQQQLLNLLGTSAGLLGRPQQPQQQPQQQQQPALGGLGAMQPGVSMPYSLMGSLGAQGEPPAKRQAINPGYAPPQQQQQQQHYQMAYQMPAGLNATGLNAAAVASNPALQSLLMQMQQRQGMLGGAAGGFGGAAGFNAAALAAYAANASANANAAANMRVAVDKGRTTDYDHQFVAEDTTAKDHADEVMRRCEEVTKMLRKTLGKHSAGDRFGVTGGKEGEGAEGEDGEGKAGAVEDEAEYHQVEQPEMIEACGDTARFLKPYQLVGINFLMLLYRSKVSGAILADEMGLGKTAQLIAYLGCIRHLENDPGPHLVVVPASLLENWQRELRRWCPELKVVIYYGKHRAVVRKRLNTLKEKLGKGEKVDDDLSDLSDPNMLAELAQSHKLAEAAAAAEADDWDDEDPMGAGQVHESDDEFDIDREKAGEDAELQPDETPPEWDIDAPCQPAPFNVMLTCYTLFERDSPEQRLDRGFLEKWRWSHLIMDEAHALKNRNASRTTRLRRVSNVSRRRIMMTGTPLQNDLSELQNLLHFLLPSVFAAQGFEDLAEMLQGDDGEIAKLTERMKSLLGPFVLRRLKQEVAGQLTTKSHATEFIEMSEEQAGLYAASVAKMRSQITGKAAAAAADRSNKGVERFLRTLGAKKISHMFTHLRKIAQHPLLVRSNYTDDQVAAIAEIAFEKALFGGAATGRRVREELLGYSDFSLHAFCYSNGPDFAQFRLNQSHMMASAKFRFLEKLLLQLKSVGSRPLIFSQWTAVLDIIEWLMEVMQLPYVRLDGSTAVDERLATVDRFNHNDDVFAFLLSTRAGGQGLNLTGADTVILHDVDFNPQIDRQAEDRCHRLGQTRPVKVYRLITKNSVDQNIYNLSQRKLRMDSAVLDGITTGKGGKADETVQMGAILHSLLMGEGQAGAPAAAADGAAPVAANGAAA